MCFAVSTCNRPNERFSTCGNNCTDSCAAATGPLACTRECQTGCFCIGGYARNTAGNCVPISQCPSKFHIILNALVTIYNINRCKIKSGNRGRPGCMLYVLIKLHSLNGHCVFVWGRGVCI